MHTIIVRVKAKIEISGHIEKLPDRFCLNQIVPLYIRYDNMSNVSLRAVIETQTEPKCCLKYTSESFEIPAYDSVEIPFTLLPESREFDFSQFLLVRLLDAETGEQLFANPMTLKFMASDVNSNDPYVYIPAFARGLFLKDRYKTIFGTEFAGGGVIDADSHRTLEFFFRVPTDRQHVIYNIDQRLYLGIQDDQMKLDLGDTVYALSPLTQYYRYGRGINLEHAWGDMRAGIHYTQNTLRCEQDPREFCAYFQYDLNKNSSFSTNYLHKVEQNIPTSNMITLQSIVNYPPNITTEAEVGANIDSEKTHNNNWAYRLEAYGRLYGDTWFSIEKIYAGSRFYGYYNNLNLFSSALDFPIKEGLRLNLSTNYLHQNFCLCDNHDKHNAIIPKQNQYSANLNYSINQNCSLNLNGFLLRGQDLGKTQQYNFYQKWYGATISLTLCECNLNGIVSFGQQKDYITHRSTHMLQRYYAYLSKDFTDFLKAYIFYDGGNINYYDVRPWRNGYGGAFSYRFAPMGFMSLFFQKVKHTCDSLDVNQYILNCNYTFKNLHRIDGMAQYYKYNTRFPNETLVVLSYTIPFSVPVAYRKDIGHLNGCVYDTWNDRLVAGAIVNCGKSQTSSQADGSFAFSCLPCGEQFPEIALLPDNLIEEVNTKSSLEIVGGKMTSLCISVVPSCSIEGEVILYAYKDMFAAFIDPSNAEIIPLNGLDGVRIAIANENQQEIYSSITNKKGEFHFPKLRPGEWHIKFFTDQIPPLHELNMNNLILTILPEETKKITFKVTPTAPQFFKLES